MFELSYVYRCSLHRVIDGDTVVLSIDLGFRAFRLENIRLLNIDTPELRPRKAGRTEESLIKEKEHAKKACEFVVHELSTAKQILVRSYPDRISFNRYLGDIRYLNTIDNVWFNLSEELRRNGFQKRKEYV